MGKTKRWEEDENRYDSRKNVQRITKAYRQAMTRELAELTRRYNMENLKHELAKRHTRTD